MKFFLVVIFGVIATTVADQSQVLKDFAVGNAQFSADVYQELLKSNSGNFLVCPLSAEINLALVQAGARGRTAQQLSTGLHLPENVEKIQQIFQELTPLLKGSDKYSLNTANKVYVKNGYKIKDQFKQTAADSFDAEIETINFVKGAQAASEMNKWVEDKTHDKIKNLISENDLNEDTRAVLLNTLYFNGTWEHPFSSRSTTKKAFYLDKHNKVEVDMMKRTTSFKYYENKDLKAKFLELPYEGDDVSMVIVLPNDIEGLADVEARIADVFVTPTVEYNRHTSVSLPKFKIDTTIQFKPILQALGIVDAFGDGADFSGILDSDEPLKISKVVQKAFIEVNERGTEASAATGQFMVFMSMPVEFTADHPFIFYIKHKDVILFVGRYTSPEA